jgi:ElaB/YqjD/DUF883 family membrane-anchored ribosome-binding protein
LTGAWFESDNKRKEQIVTTTPTKTGDEMLHEALAQLNEAAKVRREEVQQLIADKYSNLKSVLGGAAQASTEWVKEEGREVGAKAKLAASTVDKHVRRYPWHYVGGAAMTGFVAALLLRRRKHPTAE